MTLLTFTCVILTHLPCEDRTSWISCFKFHHVREGILFWVFLDLRAWLRVILYIASIGLAGMLNSSKRTLHNRAFTFSHSRSFSALFLYPFSIGALGMVSDVWSPSLSGGAGTSSMS
jgi:hypothetical protein